ncbi:MAG: DUF6602 domain-containing protein [Promethearchaeota archaeon]
MTKDQILNDVLEYWKEQREQIISKSKEVMKGDLQTLKGTHRELIIEDFFRKFFPKRFDYGNGYIIDSELNKSNQSDVVIYDAENHPIIPLRNYNYFFAESVNFVFEIKSYHNKEELEKVIEGTKKINQLKPHLKPNFDLYKKSIETRFLNIEKRLIYHTNSMDDPTEFSKSVLNTDELIPLAFPNPILTGAIFLKTQKKFDLEEALNEQGIQSIHKEWPNLMVWLEEGIVCLKYLGRITIFEPKEYCLFLVFIITISLLQELIGDTERKDIYPIYTWGQKFKPIHSRSYDWK